MEHWIQQILSADRIGLAVLPAALLLGVLGAVSSCCTAPTIGAVVGYAGSLAGRQSRRELLLVGLFFTIGTIVSLAILGAAMSFVGHAAGASLGRYWHFVAGMVLVVFGLATLRLLPFRIPTIDSRALRPGGGAAGAILCGLALGGATATCSVGCNPLLPAAVGAAVLNGTPLLGALVLAVFAVGYSLPLAAGVVGIGFGLGRLGSVAQWAMPALRVCVGTLMIAVGFYFLARG